jgi:uncharacterized protein HemX
MNLDYTTIGLIAIGMILLLLAVIFIGLFMRSKNKNQELSEELTLLGAAKALDEREIRKLNGFIEELQIKLDKLMISKSRNEKEIDELIKQIDELKSKLGR